MRSLKDIKGTSLKGHPLALAAFVLTSALGSPTLWASAPPDGSTTTKPAVSAETQRGEESTRVQAHALAKLHSINELEVKLGNLARARALLEEIERFGTKLIKHHNVLDRKVRRLAKKEGYALLLPTTTNELHQQAFARATIVSLQAVNGIEFDRAYVAALIKLHIYDIMAVQALKEQLPAGSVRTMLEDSVPAMMEHLDAARALQKQFFYDDYISTR